MVNGIDIYLDIAIAIGIGFGNDIGIIGIGIGIDIGWTVQVNGASGRSSEWCKWMVQVKRGTSGWCK